MSATYVSLFYEGGPYLALLIYFFALALLELLGILRGSGRAFFWLSIALLTLFVGLRWQVGTDWEPYKGLFESIEFDSTFLLNVYSFDLGYVLFNAAIKSITSNYTVFLLVDAAVAFGLMAIFIRRSSPYPNVSLYIFYAAYCITHFIGSNRRMIAIGLLALAIVGAYERRFGRYAILQGLAFFFHRSSVVGVLSLAIPRRMPSLVAVAAILGFCLALGLLKLPMELFSQIGAITAGAINSPLVEKLIFYSETSAEHVPENVNLLVQTIFALLKRGLFLFFYIYAMRGARVDPLSAYLFNVYVLGLCLYLSVLGSPIFQVLSTYFAIVEIALTARLLEYVSWRTRMIFAVLLLPYGLLQTVSALNAYPHLYVPYMPAIGWML